MDIHTCTSTLSFSVSLWRAVDSGRFTVHRFLAQIAASHLGFVLVFFLLLEYVLRRDFAPSPVTVHVCEDRAAGINRLGRCGLAAGAESGSSRGVNVSRRVRAGGNQKWLTLPRTNDRGV